MLEFVHGLLDSSPPLLVFTIIGLGYFLGNLRIRGFQLNVAAILFIGIAFGAWNPDGFLLPEELYMIGLMLFVYAVGLQAGPTFFAIFRERGLRLNLVAVSSLLVGFGTALALGRLFQIPAPILAGLFAGSLTNTPALAAATDAIREQMAGSGLDPETIAASIAGPTQGFSLAYPFGVIGVIMAMNLMSRWFRVSFAREREEYQKRIAEKQNIQSCEFRVTNPALFGKTLAETEISALTGLIFTRLRHEETVSLLTPQSVLRENDILVGVGSSQAIAKAQIVVGPVQTEMTAFSTHDIEHRDIVVMDKTLVGKAVFDINVDPEIRAIVSRLKRGYVQVPIDHHTTIELGDQIRVVTYAENLERACSFFGRPLQDLSETDFLSISLGLILGILLGMVPFPLPQGAVLRLGFAGGPLIAALILGRLGRTGSIIWTIPVNVNLTLRQIGLYLFLAGIGVKAGGGFISVLQAGGLKYLAIGALITMSTALSSLFLGYRLLGIEMIGTLGVTAGIHTQPACLAFAAELSESGAPNQFYAAVQPVSMVCKIILAQLLVVLFL